MAEMYKSRLQELCQRQSWSKPDYTSLKEGPSHSPSFKSSVTVNGLTFRSQVYCKHIKQSQSEAAKLAYLHFTTPAAIAPTSAAIAPTPTLIPVPAPTPTPVTTTPPSGTITSGITSEPVIMPTAHQNVHAISDTNNTLEVNLMSKNLLQTYAQKRNLGLPEYSCKREGPPHLSRFTCTVSIAENTFQCLQSFSTLKEAENAAAKLALSTLASSGLEVHNDSTLIYKNLLQELAQKQGFDLPTYSTKSGGLPHTPTFLSTVVVQGATFTGEEAKSKKQAEMSAAKAAYISIKQCCMGKSQEFIPAGFRPMEVGCSSKSVEQENIKLGPISCMDVVSEKHVNQESAEVQITSEEKLMSSPEASITNRNDGLETRRKRGASQILHPSPKSYCPSLPSSSEGGQSNGSSGLKINTRVEPETGTTNMPPHKKVCILSRKLNVEHPHGVEVCSDDQWVAIETTQDGTAT